MEGDAVVVVVGGGVYNCLTNFHKNASLQFTLWKHNKACRIAMNVDEQIVPFLSNHPRACAANNRV